VIFTFTPGTRVANDEGNRQHRRHGESMTLLLFPFGSKGREPTEGIACYMLAQRNIWHE